jgi:AcrR family transcriptional regulator
MVWHPALVTTPLPLRERNKVRTRAAIERAALDLFSARGFDAVTLAEVADAAEVGQRTLFRYFSDKEELLFGDDHALRLRLGELLAVRPEHEPATTAALEAVLGLAPMWQDSRELGRRRRAVIDASPALAARERAKHSAYEQVLLGGLVARGLDRPAARLLSRVSVTCFDEAVTRWLDDDDPQRPGLAHRVREAFAVVARLMNESNQP